MPERSEIVYFGAGPAALPTGVLETAAEQLKNFNGTGLGIAEHSHRSKHATTIINEAKADLASFLDIPSDEYEIVFMQGGGTGGFAATVYNLVGAWVARQHGRIKTQMGGWEAGREQEHEGAVFAELQKRVDRDLKIDYLVTGSWSLKASQEAARLVGPEHVNVATDARVENGGKFGSIPDMSTWELSRDAAMVYYCDNETVDGVEFPAFPAMLEPKADGSGPIVVADMSSNILSRRIPVRNYSLIFFGAQKNLGMTGVTVAVVRKILLPPLLTQPSPAMMRKLGLPVPPVVLQYETMVKNNSLYNTLSIFDVYVAGQVLKELLKRYPDKVDGQEALAGKKAKLIYDALEAYPHIYRLVPHSSARSRMNICFRVTKNGSVDGSEKAFLEQASARHLLGLKGHRSVGGVRASNYNAIPLEGAEKLVEFIKAFAI